MKTLCTCGRVINLQARVVPHSRDKRCDAFEDRVAEIRASVRANEDRAHGRRVLSSYERMADEAGVPMRGEI